MIKKAMLEILDFVKETLIHWGRCMIKKVGYTLIAIIIGILLLWLMQNGNPYNRYLM